MTSFLWTEHHLKAAVLVLQKRQNDTQRMSVIMIRGSSTAVFAKPQKDNRMPRTTTQIGLFALLLELTCIFWAPSLAFTIRGALSAQRRPTMLTPTPSASRRSAVTDPTTTATTIPPPQRKVVARCPPLGGDIYQLSTEGSSSAPVFASVALGDHAASDGNTLLGTTTEPTRLGLEAVVPGAFVVRGALSRQDCQSIIQSCERELKFGASQDGDVVELMVSDQAARQLSSRVSPHVNLNVLFDLPGPMVQETREGDDLRYEIAGASKYWRVHKYDASTTASGRTVGPCVHVGQPSARLSDDGNEIVWDDINPSSTNQQIQSRFSVIVYLNDDFLGGHDQFFRPQSEQEGHEMELLTSIKPQAGSILVFPQVANEPESIQCAQSHWPTYICSPIAGGSRPKYVLRTDILVTTSHGLDEQDIGNVMFQFDALVRDAFLPRSPIVDKSMASQLASLYNPHMGVENAGPLLYSIVRFTKPRKVVEIGAGYTSLWLLQALKDNDAEMQRVFQLQRQGKCRLLDYPWSIVEYVDEYMRKESSLLCIDNCLHQRETATGAAAVAANLGLDSHFQFIEGDAYDMQFDEESIDLLWCDFGVGNRMRDFALGAWKSIRPGGFLVCHSTLTNKGTRDWLENVRARRDESVTGIPPQEVVELSLLEPTKRYQNSLTILQRRKSGTSGTEFVEPIYSLYA